MKDKNVESLSPKFTNQDQNSSSVPFVSNKKESRVFTDNLVDQVVTPFLSPLGLLLLLCVGALLYLSLGSGLGKGNKYKLARGRWAGREEKKTACKIACRQIEERKHNRVALYISKNKVPLPVKAGRKYLIQIPKYSSTLYLPDCQRGVIVCGSTGSGKTYSLINPIIRSSIDQGFTTVLYDLKYSSLKGSTDKSLGQSSKIAGYAIERGYKVYVLAPSFPESSSVNLLDFLKDETDSAMARQLAIALNKNLKLSSGDKDSSGFFANAGDLLTQGIFQLAKGTKYPDILMCFAILSLNNLISRIQTANLNLWTKTSFSQFLSVAQSPETAASIIGTALGLFTRFIIPEILTNFCTTNLPLDLKGRELVIFGTDDEKRDVVSPLIASVLHLLVTRNLAQTRTTPLILSLDELPTIYLPSLPSWLNQKRENGLVAILGLQNLSQLEESYGKEIAETIFTGCVTKVFFNAGSNTAAERYSKYLGEEEVTNKRSSRSTGKGVSINHSVEISKRPLFEASQFNTLPEGKCVIINPSFKSLDEAALPLLHKIQLSRKVESQLEEKSLDLWYQYQQEMKNQLPVTEVLEEDLKVRLEEANRILPLMPNKSQTIEQILAKF